MVLIILQLKIFPRKMYQGPMKKAMVLTSWTFILFAIAVNIRMGKSYTIVTKSLCWKIYLGSSIGGISYLWVEQAKAKAYKVKPFIRMSLFRFLRVEPKKKLSKTVSIWNKSAAATLSHWVLRLFYTFTYAWIDA